MLFVGFGSASTYSQETQGVGPASTGVMAALPSFVGRWSDADCSKRWNDVSISGVEITFHDQSGGTDVEKVVGASGPGFITETIVASVGKPGAIWKYEPRSGDLFEVKNVSTGRAFPLRRCQKPAEARPSLAGTTVEPASAVRRIGPSFDCGKAADPLALLICGNDALARTDLAYNQTYQALRQQIGEGDQPPLRRQANDFLKQVRSNCGIPTAGAVAPALALIAAACVERAYGVQRDAWMRRLTPPALEEASRPLEQHIRLQGELQKLGYVSSLSPVNGVYGPGTRDAIKAWQVAAGLDPTGLLNGVDARRLVADAGQPPPVGTPAPSRQDAPAGMQGASAEVLRARAKSAFAQVSNRKCDGAEQLIRPAAESGDPAAQFYLGLMYANGCGIGKSDADADADAAKWYRSAADQGIAAAMVNLGILYERGRGVQRDETEAVRWYRQAAERNNSIGQRNLGGLYEFGRGVPQDYALSREWYEKAAAQGDDDAALALAQLYEMGQGGPKDLDRALRYYRQASAGNPAAGQSVVRLEALAEASAQSRAKAQKEAERQALAEEVTESDCNGVQELTRAFPSICLQRLSPYNFLDNPVLDLINNGSWTWSRHYDPAMHQCRFEFHTAGMVKGNSYNKQFDCAFHPAVISRGCNSDTDRGLGGLNCAQKSLVEPR